MRKWSVYERNQLRRHGHDEGNLDKYGEMPVEYITGHCDFDGLVFEVNKDVLIPRVETVQMVDEAEKLLVGRTEITFAEIGTGCGAIGISLYKRLKAKSVGVKGTLTDVSAPAVKIAKINYRRLLPEDDGLEIFVSDLMEGVPAESKFDLILANLPYIPTSRVPRLPESVVDYEPHLALDGGPEGLTLIKKLLGQAGERLFEGGALILEIDYSHDIPDFLDVAGYQYEIVRDDFGQNRFLVARLRRRS